MKLTELAKLAAEMVCLAQRHPSLPVALIQDGDTLIVGVLSIISPTGDDWFFFPVPVDKLNVIERQAPRVGAIEVLEQEVEQANGQIPTV